MFVPDLPYMNHVFQSALMLTEEIELNSLDSNIVNGTSTHSMLTGIVKGFQLTSVPLGKQQPLQATWDFTAVPGH